MMKRIHLSALALAAAAVAAPAFAQSSVTVYGRLNTTIENQKVNGGSRVWKLENNASRLGFKGVEDMGGGLKASFNLEHGLSSDTGAVTQGYPGTFWGREAWVQLAGGFGAVRLGNFTPESYFATADYISMHNHDTGSSSDSLYEFATGYPTNDVLRSNNKVGYFTPTFGGFSGSIAFSAGEGAANKKRLTDVAANYDSGPLHLGAGYTKSGDMDQWALRALYELGAFTLGAYYQQADRGPGTATYKNARAAVMYTMGASEFHVNYGRATNGDQFTLGYNYNLSKRTKLYGYYTDLDTDRTMARSGEFSSLAFGVRHNF